MEENAEGIADFINQIKVYPRLRIPIDHILVCLDYFYFLHKKKYILIFARPQISSLHPAPLVFCIPRLVDLVDICSGSITLRSSMYSSYAFAGFLALALAGGTRHATSDAMST